MATDEHMSDLRKAILSVCPIEETVLKHFLYIFSSEVLEPEELFARGGDYSTHFGFIQKGIIKSYYSDLKGNDFIKGIFTDHMFVLPLPSFLYRKPTYLNFKTLVRTEILRANYIKLEEIARKYSGIQRFVYKLIENEWILNRELHEAGMHIYNPASRYRIFAGQYRDFQYEIPPEDIASFLNIPVKQVLRFMKEFQTSGI